MHHASRSWVAPSLRPDQAMPIPFGFHAFLPPGRVQNTGVFLSPIRAVPRRQVIPQKKFTPPLQRLRRFIRDIVGSNPIKPLPLFDAARSDLVAVLDLLNKKFFRDWPAPRAAVLATFSSARTTALRCTLKALRSRRSLRSPRDRPTALVETETGNPVTTEILRPGLRVTVVGLPCSPLMKTAKALKAVGPKAFGSELPYIGLR